MRLRTLLVLTGIAVSAYGEDQDFLRKGPVIAPEQFRTSQRDMQRNMQRDMQRSGKQQPDGVAAVRPLSRCSVPLKNLMPTTPPSNMPTIAPDDKIRFTIKYVAPPAPACEPNERPDR